jgi:protein-disulfide isomerase
MPPVQNTKSSSRGPLYIILGVLALIVVAGGVYAATQSSRPTVSTLPNNTNAQGTITVGSGPTVVDIYQDYQCPNCARVEDAVGDDVNRLIADGSVTVNYQLMSFLGPESERGTAAAFCAADANTFSEYNTYLLANQPGEKTGGYTTSDLIAAGTAVGLGEDFSECVRSGTYASLVGVSDDTALQNGVSATPTYVVDGTPLRPETTADILADIGAAVANKAALPSVDGSAGDAPAAKRS